MQVFDGAEGLYEAESGVYDLILLDLMLPEKDGFQVLKELREKGISTPVLIMTAKESLDDKGHGFELGADDYLTKPFYLEELKMRIQALLKRSGKFNNNTLSYHELTADTSTNTTTVNGEKVELLGKEFDLLVYFLQNQMSFCQNHKFLTVFGALTVIQQFQLLKYMFQKFVKNSKALALPIIFKHYVV